MLVSMSQDPHIDPARTWLISDTHFGHENIVGFCDRPDEHEEVIVRHWTEEVPDSATVIHLGDFSYRNNGYTKNIIAPKLTGSRKLLIPGNHDRGRPNFYRECGFKIVKPFSISYLADRRNWSVSFSHYPLAAPPPPRTVHIHGHIHNNGYGGKAASFTPFSAGQINISVEQTHYSPVNLKCLLDGYILGCYEP